ncbi:MAG: bifunctional heptose 7-phosphate kinase/heptose 1-phosphate adenyltransferase [Anaerolineae bacterium]
MSHTPSPTWSRMTAARLEELLEGFPRLRVLVVGDFFLDKYLHLDRRLSEVSLETGLEAYQVVQVRPQPGAAGTVVSNLRALDVGVVALGVLGDDGEGYELRRALLRQGVDVSPLVQREGLFTPTYTKPLMQEPDGTIHELNRLDIKNRAPLPREVEEAVLARLRDLVPQVHGVAVVDQVQERNCGVVTDRVREEIAALARTHPQVVFAVESRERIGLFRDVILQANRSEALRAVRPTWQGEASPKAIAASAAELHRRAGKPVFITLGEGGIWVHHRGGGLRIPAVPVSGPIDPVGAGDSVLAGVLGSLCCGATPEEAACVGNLVASITIQQIGTTGTASRAQVQARFQEWLDTTGNAPDCRRTQAHV